MEQFQNLKQQLQETVRQRMDMSSELSDAQIGEIIDSVIMEKSREVYMSAVTKLTLRQELFNAIRRLDLLQELKAVAKQKQDQELPWERLQHVFFTIKAQKFVFTQQVLHFCMC